MIWFAFTSARYGVVTLVKDHPNFLEKYPILQGQGIPFNLYLNLLQNGVYGTLKIQRIYQSIL